MTLEEKKERLIAMEWEDFRNVNNEGGKADCQENPGTSCHAEIPVCPLAGVCG